MSDQVGPGSDFTGHKPDDAQHPSVALAEHYRAGLARIADAESGPWGVIARETLEGAPE